jgi:uncharacterized membrane protein SirB2
VDYLAVKTIHQTAVALSFGGFVVRGLAALRGARWVRARAARTLPHVVDSVLLASALVLAWSLRLDPTATPWLAAKIVGLLAYIALGIVALRPGRPVGLRARRGSLRSSPSATSSRSPSPSIPRAS